MKITGYMDAVIDWLMERMADKDKKASIARFTELWVNMVEGFKILYAEHRGYEAQAAAAHRMLGQVPPPSRYGRDGSDKEDGEKAEDK